MSNVTLRAFHAWVRPEVAGCPEALVTAAIRDAARKLCTRSRLWTGHLPAQGVYAGIGSYRLYADYPAEVIAPIEVAFNARPLTHVPLERLEAQRPYWRDETASAPSAWTMLDARELRLVSAPDADAAEALTVFASLRPAEDADAVPQWLLEGYDQAIEHGALARLLAMRARSWSDPQAALTHGRLFAFELGQAARAAVRGHAQQPTSVRLRAFV